MPSKAPYIALPWIVPAARNLCLGSGMPPRVTVFLSLLVADAVALVGGALVSWMAGRFELWIAGGSVLTGLAIVAAFYWKETEQRHEELIRSHAVGFSTPFVLFAVLGAGLVSF